MRGKKQKTERVIPGSRTVLWNHHNDAGTDCRDSALFTDYLLGADVFS